MRYRKLSPTGDYTFGGGQMNFYRDVPAAVGQAVLTRLELWLGEWFLDINEGTPYMQGVLGTHSKSEADVTIQDRALGTQGITNLTNFDTVVNPDNRGLTGGFNIDTIYGPTAVELENYGNY